MPTLNERLGGRVCDLAIMAGADAPCPERKLKSRRPVSRQVLTPRLPAPSTGTGCEKLFNREAIMANPKSSAANADLSPRLPESPSPSIMSRRALLRSASLLTGGAITAVGITGGAMGGSSMKILEAPETGSLRLVGDADLLEIVRKYDELKACIEKVEAPFKMAFERYCSAEPAKPAGLRWQPGDEQFYEPPRSVSAEVDRDWNDLIGPSDLKKMKASGAARGQELASAWEKWRADCDVVAEAVGYSDSRQGEHEDAIEPLFE